MGQEKLHDIAVLSIEQSIARTLDFEDVIDNYAEIKATQRFLKYGIKNVIKIEVKKLFLMKVHTNVWQCF